MEAMLTLELILYIDIKLLTNEFVLCNPKK